MDHRKDQTQEFVRRLQECLQELIGLHRQLLDNVRAEKQALIQAQLKSIEEVTSLKQAIIQAIHVQEQTRKMVSTELAFAWKIPVQELTLGKVIHEIQGRDLKQADQMRSSQNTLVILTERISAQNKENAALIERSLVHVTEMKQNILGATTNSPGTYGNQGKTINRDAGPRLVSKEV